MKMIKFLAVTAAVLGLAGFAPQASAATMTGNFIRNATVGNGFEIMSSRMALQRSQNPEVRDFAQRMINDHSQADQELRNTIMTSRYRMMNMPNDLDAKHRRLLNQLARAQGPMFDRLYVKDQIAAHNDAVSLFNNYAHNGHNPALRQFAADTLPTLEEHRDHIRQIRMYR